MYAITNLLVAMQKINSIEICAFVCFFSKFSDLFKWFKDFLGYKETGFSEAVPQTATGKERISGELAMEIGKKKE